MRSLLLALAACCAVRAFLGRPAPSEEAPVEAPPKTDPPPDRTAEFYRQVEAQRRLPSSPGRRLKRDRYGIVYERNPNGFGWRELGSDPDEPYWVNRLD